MHAELQECQASNVCIKETLKGLEHEKRELMAKIANLEGSTVDVTEYDAVKRELAALQTKARFSKF